MDNQQFWMAMDAAREKAVEGARQLGRAAGERQGQKSGPGAAALQQAGGGKQQGEGQRDGAGAAPGGGFDLPVPLVGEQVERLGLAALFFTGAVHGKSLLQV